MGGKGASGRLMSPAQETQSMREIRLLRGRLPRKGGGLTGMLPSLLKCNKHYRHTIVHMGFKLIWDEVPTMVEIAIF